MTMKVSSSLAAFALFGKSIAISLSSDASVESHISVQEEAPTNLTDDCCFLYSENYYRGNKDWICVDKSDAKHGDHSMHIQSGGNTIKSWRCGKNTKITFCEREGPQWVDGPGYTCGPGNSTSAGRVDNPLTHFWATDGFDSAGVQAYDRVNHGGPVRFTDVDAHGQCFGGTHLMPITSLQYPTQYTDLNVYWHGIQVPYGYSASVYQDTYYSDLKNEYYAKIDEDGHMKCESWKCDEYKCPGSLIVHQHADQGGYGYWELIGSSQEEETFTYTVGFTKSHSNVTTKADEDTMTMAMEFSMTVGIPDADSETEKYSLTAGYKHTVTQSATTTMTKTESKSVTYECTPHSERSGVQLYQWVVTSGGLSIRDPSVVCVYNLEQNAAPKCPLAACVTLKCEACKDGWKAGPAV